MAADRALTVSTADGRRLAVARHASAGPPRARVLLLHAMMADARSLDRPAGRGLASTLAARGLEAWRADLRGHGGSGPGAREGASWTYEELVRFDVPALVAAARADGLPLVVLGHSLGGHAALAAAVEGARPDAFVLLATNVWLPSLEPSRRRRWRKALVFRAFEAAAIPRGRFPARRLRFGPCDEPLAYVRDLCRFWWEDRWGPRAGGDWLAGLRALSIPTLAVAGAGDRLEAHPEPARLFADHLPPGTVDFWLARRGRLGLEVDPDHMGLGVSEACRPLWERVADWVHDRAG